MPLEPIMGPPLVWNEASNDDLKSYNDAKNSGRHILTHNIDY